MPLSTSHIEDTFSSRDDGIKRLLSSILNLNLQHETNEKHIINVINKLLSTAKHRREGLEYLYLVINNCSSSIINENAINWTNHCIIKFADDIFRELKLRVLGEIIEVAHNDSDFNKKIVSEYMSKILDNCTTTSHINPYESKTALKTLTIAMQYYPSWFGAHRQKIENYILIFLDSEKDDLVETASLAFHYLQQIGSAGANGINHKLNFTQSFHKLCRTVHQIFNKLFENEREIFRMESSNDDNVFNFQDDPSSNTQILLHINARRIKNVLKFIETMIKKKFPVAKETKPKELLEVITRGMSVHKCISGDNTESLETYQFSFLLMEIQCKLLKLLRLFIIWYQSNCLPFSYSISKIIVDSIEKSHNCECFKYDSLYQESSYRALSEWLTTVKSSLHSQFQSQLLVCILKDVTPIKNQVTLTISEALSGKKSQKAKRKAMANRIISSGSQTLSSGSSTHYEKNSEKNTCKFALSALRHLLEFTRLNVKPLLVKDLYKSIFDSLTTIQSSKPLHPYTDPQCQAKLYEVLVAIYHQNTLSVMPPLQTSLDILTRGANNSNQLISDICQTGLRTLEILCQPICPSLYLGVEKDDIEDQTAVEVYDKIIVEGEDDEGDVSSIDYEASTDEYSPDVSFNHPKALCDATEKHTDHTDAETVINNSNKDNIDNEMADDFDKSTQSEIQIEEIDPGVEDVSDVENLDKEVMVSSKEEVECPPTQCSSSFQQSYPERRQPEKQIFPSLPIYHNLSGYGSFGKARGKINNQKKLDSLASRHGPPLRRVSTALQSSSDENICDSSENQTESESKGEQATNVELTNTELGKDECSDTPKNLDQEAESLPVELEEQADHPEKSLEAAESNVEDSNNLQVGSEEPPAKKAKLAEEDEDMGDVFDEKVEKSEEKKSGEDSDSNLLDDDSFVDEVKDYY